MKAICLSREKNAERLVVVLSGGTRAVGLHLTSNTSGQEAAGMVDDLRHSVTVDGCPQTHVRSTIFDSSCLQIHPVTFVNVARRPCPIRRKKR